MSIERTERFTEEDFFSWIDRLLLSNVHTATTAITSTIKVRVRLKQRISSLQARPPRLKMLFLCVLIRSSGTLLFTAWFSVDQLWFFAAVHYCCCCRWPGTGRRWSCRMGTGFTPPASATPSPSAWTGWARRTLPATPAGLRTASRERSQPPYKSQVCQILFNMTLHVSRLAKICFIC